MMLTLRCCVCYRLLGLVETNQRRRTYCPDRLCYLYPSTALSRAEDPTVSTWMYGISTMTNVPDRDASIAVGRDRKWGRDTVHALRERWKNLT